MVKLRCWMRRYREELKTGDVLSQFPGDMPQSEGLGELVADEALPNKVPESLSGEGGLRF